MRSAVQICAFSLALGMAAIPALAIEPGTRVQELRAEKWFFDSAPQPVSAPVPGAAKLEQFDIYLIFDCSDAGSFAVLKLLEGVKAADPDHIRNVKAVAIDSVKELEDFFKRNGQVAFPVGADTANSASFKAYCESNSLLPQAFVIKQDGTLAWAGHPTGVESVMKRIKDGSFSVESQRRIAALRTELQTAIQSGLGAVIAKNAERILLIDPGDMIAIQSRLFVFERESDFNGARKFLTEACAKHPKDAELRIAFLAFLARTGDVDSFRSEALKCYVDFKGDNSFQPRFCAFMLEGAPFGSMPLQQVMEAAKANLAIKMSSPSVDARASAHELLARACYYAGRMSEAVSEQASAVILRKGGSYEAPSAALLEFYRQASALQSAK